MNEHYLAALRQHDLTLPRRAGEIPQSWLEDVARNWQTLDAEARSLAVSTAWAMAHATAGRFLQSLAGLRGEPVAVQAASALFDHPQAPDGGSLLVTASNAADPAVRMHLYRAAAVRGGPVAQLEQRHNEETDLLARTAARDGLARLGHVPSLRALFAAAAKATALEVMDIRDSLLFANDKRLAKALVPWLESQDAVNRASSDRSPAMLRQCDHGLWIAHLLKAGVAIPVDHIAIYPAAAISAAKPVLEALPDIEPRP